MTDQHAILIDMLAERIIAAMQGGALAHDLAAEIVAAIDASGTHAVVPAEPTPEMISAAVDARLASPRVDPSARTIYLAMLKAAPKAGA